MSYKEEVVENYINGTKCSNDSTALAEAREIAKGSDVLEEFEEEYKGLLESNYTTTEAIDEALDVLGLCINARYIVA